LDDVINLAVTAPVFPLVVDQIRRGHLVGCFGWAAGRVLPVTATTVSLIRRLASGNRFGRGRHWVLELRSLWVALPGRKANCEHPGGKSAEQQSHEHCTHHVPSRTPVCPQRNNGGTEIARFPRCGLTRNYRLSRYFASGSGRIWNLTTRDV